MTLTYGSLFAGIGGIDLGLDRAGMEGRWQVEVDEYCRRVLRKHWPAVTQYEDVRKQGANLERVDVIAGGFPCQPFSWAGKQQGQADPRHLWPEFARIVGLLRPTYVLAENVRGLCSRGLAEVLGDLTAMGYDAEWQVVSAAAVGAPHMRERVFIVAYTDGSTVQPRRERRGVGQAGEGAIDPVADAGGRTQQRPEHEDQAERAGHRQQTRLQPEVGDPGRGQRGTHSHVADADSEGQADAEGWPRPPWPDRRTIFGPNSFDGGAYRWCPEPDVGRVAHGVPDRLDRLRALGNAVVPQVAEFVGGVIIDHARRNPCAAT